MRAWPAIVACVVMLLGVRAQAQQAPPPAPSAVDGDAKREFVAAYKRAGSPSLLIYMDTLGGTGAGAEARGQIAQQLGGAIQAALADPEVTFLPSEATAALSDQQRQTIRDGDSLAGARAIGKAAGADVVLYARLIEQPGQHAVLTGTLLLADIRRGVSLGRHAWDMVPSATGAFDPARTDEHGRTIARKVMDQFSQFFPEGGSLSNMRRIPIRVVGDYQPGELEGFKEALSTVPGVKPGSPTLRSEDEMSGTRVATFEVAFSGDLVDLRKFTRRAVVNQMAMQAASIDSREGAIGFKLANLNLSQRERMLTGGAKTARNSTERDRLLLAWANAGRPAIGVVFNRHATDSIPADAPNGDTRIAIGERQRIGDAGPSGAFAERVIDRELRSRRSEFRDVPNVDPRVFEDALAVRAAQLGLTVNDLSRVQAELAAASGFQDRPWTDRDFAVALGQKAQVPVVITGVSRLGRENPEAPQLTLTARAVDVATGEVLASLAAARTLGPTGDSLASAIEELSAEATAKLMVQLLDRWEAAPRR
jgi:hypothetical protein